MTDAPMVPVEAKPVVKSKTTWYAWLKIVAGALLLIQQAPITLSPELAGGIVIVAGIITQILRVVTTQPITMSLAPQVGEAPAPPWTPTVTGPPRGLPR